MRQESKKLGEFLGKWNGETEARLLKANLSNLQALGGSQDLSFRNRGHVRANGLYLSSLTREHTASISLVWETEPRLMPSVPAKPEVDELGSK